MVFPTVSTEVLGSVPQTEVGVASGTNSALRELGGVFGVAVLASVFARPGIYTNPGTFVDGFKAALWVGAAFSLAGVAAAATRGRRRPTDTAGTVTTFPAREVASNGEAGQPLPARTKGA